MLTVDLRFLVIHSGSRALLYYFSLLSFLLYNNNLLLFLPLSVQCNMKTCLLYINCKFILQTSNPECSQHLGFPAYHFVSDLNILLFTSLPSPGMINTKKKNHKI